MKCRRAVQSVSLMLSAMLVIVSLANSAPPTAIASLAQQSSCQAPTWCVSPSQSGSGIPNLLRGVAVVGDNDVWAVGTSNVGQFGGTPITEHWNGSSWATGSSPAPDPSRNYLASAAAIASNNVWLVGAYYTGTNTAGCNLPAGLMFVQCTLVEQWNGTSWNLIPSPNVNDNYAVGSALNAVAVLPKDPSYHDIVAAGSTFVNAPGSSYNQSLIEYYHNANSSWEIMDTHNLNPYPGNALTGVATSNGANDSLDEMWAVGYGYGYSGGRNPIIGHYSASGGWQLQQSSEPTNQDAYLSAVDVFAPSDVWAVGAYETNNIYYPLIEHWDGSNWHYADNLSGITGILSGVFVTKERDVWAVGGQGGSTLVMHWYGSSLDDKNSWTVVPSQNPGGNNPLLAVGALPGIIAGPISSVWAVGSSDANTLVEDIQSPTAPYYSRNYFVETINPQTHYSKGCDAGNRLESGAIVLDYGKPKDLGSGVYGTLLLDGQTKVTTEQITKAVESFADGYHDGRFGTNRLRCPFEIGPPVGSLTIAVGINNDNRDGLAALTPQHARAWATMIKTIKAYVFNKGYSEMNIVAAMDAEEGWSNYSDAAIWATYYNSYQTSTYYNFGSIDNYPCDNNTRIPNPPFTGGCTGWKIYQFYQISWGIGGKPLPEIYHTLEARYWYLVDRWGIDSGNGSMTFIGETTHWRSCGCDYNPAQAWQVFWLELNQDPQTVQQIVSTDFDDMPQQ